jgi:hypothetical protein
MPEAVTTKTVYFTDPESALFFMFSLVRAGYVIDDIWIEHYGFFGWRTRWLIRYSTKPPPPPSKPTMDLIIGPITIRPGVGPPPKPVLDLRIGPITTRPI